MEITAQHKKVEESETFKEWKECYPNAFLSGIFVTVHESQKDWQILYYDPKSEQSAAFQIAQHVSLLQHEKTFKEPGSTVHPLSLAEVTLDIDECLQRCSAEQRKNHPAALPSKMFVILQCLPMGTVYNVTSVTKTLSTLNIKIDGKTKKIQESKMIPILSFHS